MESKKGRVRLSKPSTSQCRLSLQCLQGIYREVGSHCPIGASIVVID